MRKFNKQLTFILLIGFVLLTLDACSNEELIIPTSIPSTVKGDVTDNEPTEVLANPETIVILPDNSQTVEPKDITWAPKVIYSSPSLGEESLLDSAITIRFDQPMNQASVEEAFRLTIGDGEGIGTSVAGTFSWPQADTFIFTPQTELTRKTKYNLDVDGFATGENGQALGEKVSLLVETVGFLQASQVLPLDGSKDVGADAAIIVIFNRPVVPLVATQDQTNLPHPLTINPPISGNGQWVSTSIYRFVPTEAWAGATTYQVRVQGDLKDVVGSPLTESVQWQFTTVDPKVVDMLPRNHSENILPDDSIELTFNMPMDQTSVEDAVAISPAQPVNYLWAEDSRSVKIAPVDKWTLGTIYIVNVGNSARSLNGQATLDEAFSSGFNIIPFPRVLEVLPAPSSIAERWQRGVTIRFASPMDIDILEDQIVIEPTPKRFTTYFNQYDNSYTLDFDLQKSTEYRVTVPAMASDPYGNTIGNDFAWTFTTPPYDPLVSLNLPQPISQLSNSYPTNVTVIHRNVSVINAALFNLGLPLDLIKEPYRIQENEKPLNINPIQTWEIPTDTPTNQASTATLSLGEGATLANGVYLVQVTAPEIGQEQRYWQNQNHIMVVADTNLVVKQTFEHIYVWATNLTTGNTASGLEITLYDELGNVINTTVTDINGLATFDYVPRETYLDQVMVVSNQPGEIGFGIASTQWDYGINPWAFNVDANYGEPSSVFSYLYTDRPIYRPGDTVYFKGILRLLNYGRYQVPANRLVTAGISFLYNYGENEFTQTFDLDEMGTFHGSFVIPKEAELGTYRLFLLDEPNTSERLFTVAEYRKPEFLVEIVPSVTDVLRGESAEVTIKASYFFGGPAPDLTVNWNIYQEQHQPDIPTEPYFSFVDSDTSLNSFLPGMPTGGFFGGVILSGEGQTNSDGEFVIEIPASLLDDIEAGSVNVTIEANLIGLNNQPIAGRTDITFHAAEIYAGISPVDYVSNTGSSTSIDIVTVDWEGNRIPNADVEIVFYQREWVSERVTNMGQTFTEWKPVDTEVSRSVGRTNANGEAVASFVPEIGGTYIIKVSVTDDGGRSHTSSVYLWVAGSNYIDWRVDPKEKRMDLTPNQPEYQVGDIAQVLVQTPFEAPVNAWLIIERGDVIEQRIVTLNSNSQVLEIPLLENYAPNVYVTVVAVKGIDNSNPYADIRLGLTELVISPERLGLNVTLTPQADLFEPRDTVAYDIAVTDYAGNPVVADLSLALVDLSILTLKEDNAPAILDTFYAHEPYRSRMGSGLFVSGEGLEVEIPSEQLGLGGGGGGMEVASDAFLLRADSDDEAAESEEDESIRREFPDTAFWQATLRTNINGQATIQIPLPDSLTTWRLSSKAITANTFVGQAEVDVVVTKPVLVRPVTPRFFTVGDVVQLGMIVHNNTNETLDIDVSLEAVGLRLSQASKTTIVLAAHSQQWVQWQATVEDVSMVDLTFRANAGNYTDVTKPTFGIAPDQLIPVYQYNAEDIVGTSGFVEEGEIVEAILLPFSIDPTMGNVDIRLTPSLAASLLDALEAIDHDYSDIVCAHSVTDQLLPNIAIARALRQLDLSHSELKGRLDNLIDEGLSHLEEMQKADGGWGWCFASDSDPYLSAYVLLGLAKAQEASYGVNSPILEQGVDYLFNQLLPANRLHEASGANRQAFYLYVLAELGEDINIGIDELLEQRDVLDPYAKGLLVLAYARTDNRGAGYDILLADLNDTVILSATGAHWEDVTRDWNNLNSDIRGTAIVLNALTQHDANSPLALNAVRWLMTARTASYWQTGQQNAWVILALSDWMLATGELDANFAYSLAVNNVDMVNGQFTPENVTELKEIHVPVNMLPREDVTFLAFGKEGEGRLYYTAHLDSFIDANSVHSVDRGFRIERVYYDATCNFAEVVCEPIDTIEAGQQVRVVLTVIVPNDRLYTVMEDFFPAGTEAIDPGLATSTFNTASSFDRVDDDYRFGYWGWWYFNRIEYRDNRVVFFSDFLPAGTYQYSYLLQATLAGEYQVMPTLAQEEFFPELFGRSNGMVFTITD